MDILKLKNMRLQSGCPYVDLLNFERKYSLLIPSEHKKFLSITNGVDINEPFLSFVFKNNESNRISHFSSLEEIELGFDMLKEDIENGSGTYFFTDSLLPIAGTEYSGARVFIGYKEPYLNKIYYADYDELD